MFYLEKHTPKKIKLFSVKLVFYCCRIQTRQFVYLQYHVSITATDFSNLHIIPILLYAFILECSTSGNQYSLQRLSFCDAKGTFQSCSCYCLQLTLPDQKSKGFCGMKEKLQTGMKALLKNRIFFVLSYLIAFPQREKEKSNFSELNFGICIIAVL